MALEFRHLRYFVAVAEEGHITRAAERLGLQQPPLSQQIRALERIVGEPLFRRKPRGVEMTDAGRAFLTEARSTLAQSDRAIDTARRAARGEQGKLSIGFTSTAPFHPLVPNTIRAFRDACPMVALTVEECLSSELADRLARDQIDVAFMRTSLGASDRLVAVELDVEPMVMALASGHPLLKGATKRPIVLAAMADVTFILAGPPDTGLHDAIIASCRAAGFNPRVGNLGASTPQAPRITSTLSLVAAGCGVTCVPRSLQRFRMPGVTYRDIAAPFTPHVPLSLGFRRGDTSAIVRRFAGLVRRVTRPGS